MSLSERHSPEGPWGHHFALPYSLGSEAAICESSALNAGIARRGDRDGKLDQLELALYVFGEMEAFVTMRLSGKFGGGRFHGFVGLGGHFLGVGGDEGFLHPLGALELDPEIEQATFGGVHEFAGFVQRGRVRAEMRHRVAGVF